MIIPASLPSRRSLQAALANMKQPAEFVCGQMQTFLDKAIPDAKLTQQAYEKARSKYLVRRPRRRLCARPVRPRQAPAPAADAMTRRQRSPPAQAHCVVIHEFSDRQDYASATSQTLKRMSTGNYIFRCAGWWPVMLCPRLAPSPLTPSGCHSFALRETLRARAVHDRLKADLEIKLDLLDSKHGMVRAGWTAPLPFDRPPQALI